MVKSKKIYLGQEFNSEDWSHGLGSICLFGAKGPWISEMADKIISHKTPLCIFLPYNSTKKNIHPDVENKWIRDALMVSTCRIMWYPESETDVRTYIESGFWIRSESTFIGGPSTPDYLKSMYYREQRMYCPTSIDEMAEMVVYWIRG
jgi:hypothetical protein